MPARRGNRKSAEGPTVEALAGGLIALVPAYLFMESIFGTYPHPAHWVGTALGVAGGYGAGTLVAAYKEGRFPFGRARSNEVRAFRPGQRRVDERRERSPDARRVARRSSEPEPRRGRRSHDR